MLRRTAGMGPDQHGRTRAFEYLLKQCTLLQRQALQRAHPELSGRELIPHGRGQKPIEPRENEAHYENEHESKTN